MRTQIPAPATFAELTDLGDADLFELFHRFLRGLATIEMKRRPVSWCFLKAISLVEISMMSALIRSSSILSPFIAISTIAWVGRLFFKITALPPKLRLAVDVGCQAACGQSTTR